MLAHVANRQLDHLGRNLQPAIDGAAQRLGLHHGETQIVAMILRAGAIIPAAVFALRVGDQLQRPLEHGTDPRVVRHAVGLAENEGRQAVVVHIALRIGDVQQARRLGVAEDIIQGLLDIAAIFAAAGRVAIGEKRQSAHADQPQVVRLSSSLRAPGFARANRAHAPTPLHFAA